MATCLPKTTAVCLSGILYLSTLICSHLIIQSLHNQTSQGSQGGFWCMKCEIQFKYRLQINALKLELKLQGGNHRIIITIHNVLIV